MDLDFTGFITTDCGKKFKIDIFDQLAIGVIQSEQFLQNPSYIPTTFALYKTITDLFLLETTSYDQVAGDLITTYKIITELEAEVYLNNCIVDI